MRPSAPEPAELAPARAPDAPGGPGAPTPDRDETHAGNLASTLGSAETRPAATSPAAPGTAEPGFAKPDIAAPDAPGTAPAVASAPETAAPRPDPATDATTASPERTAAVAPDTGPRILRLDQEGLSVVQDATPAKLSIDSISYDPEGQVVLGGRAPGAAPVRVYLDNRPLETTVTRPDGQWRLDLPPLEERVYSLRVDQLTETGGVAARAETPFRPESPARLAGGSVDLADGMTRVTVQPGYTLWAIAERRYGAGPSYVRVFEANADKIRNPDLIYPGQIFDMPDDLAPGGEGASDDGTAPAGETVADGRTAPVPD